MLMLQYHYLATWLTARTSRTERGAALVEYALLVALIAVVCVTAISFLGGNTSKKFSQVGNSIK